MRAPIPAPPYGMISAGNIDPHKRPVVRNPDGTISTVRTISAGFDNGEVLMPTVSPDGRILSDDDAIDLYRQTGQNFGTFRTPEAATQFAQRLHNSQATEYADRPQKMGTLTINGRKVQVDASFGSLSPEQQQQTVEEIAAQMSIASVAPKPGSREYADWAAAEARAGRKLPQVSPAPPEWKDPYSSDLGAKAQAMSSAWLNDIPVAGPAILDTAQKAKAALWNVPLETVQADTQRAMDANPVESKTAGVASSVASLVPLGATALGGRLLGMTGNLGSRVALGGASSALLTGADTLARGGSLQDAGTNAGIGAVIGGAIPVVGSAIRRAITPLPANAAKTRAAQVLQREGVDLTAGQRTGSKGLQYREAELGGNAADDFMERQADQFTAAALRRVGVQANRATPDVIDAAYRDIGQQFDDLASRNGALLDVQLGRDMRTAVDEYNSLVPEAARAPIVENIRQSIIDIVRNTGANVMDGPAYQALRSRLERAARSSRDPELARVLRDLRGALDDAVNRFINTRNPADAGAWREARRRYANMLVVEDAATRAGERAADGIISPQALRSAAMRQNKRAYARGRNEFTDLANAGVSAMSPLPNSGTPGRLGAKTLMPLGAATGAGIGGTVAGIAGALIGGAVDAAIPWGAGRAMLSGPGRAYLGNQLAPRIPGLLPPAAVPLVSQN